MDSGPGLGFAKREGNPGLSPKLAVWEADLTSGHIKSCCGEVGGSIPCDQPAVTTSWSPLSLKRLSTCSASVFSSVKQVDGSQVRDEGAAVRAIRDPE